MKRMLVLYRELAGYFVNNMNNLAKNHHVYIDIVAFPVQDDAPFQFVFHPNIQVFKRNDITDEQIAERVESNVYDLIFCGGWSEKGYLRAISKRGNTPALIGFDKQWLGGLKDRLATQYLKIKVKSLFEFAFVPGSEQATFAAKMGFDKAAIFQGAYTCETQRFDQIFQWRQNQPNLIRKQVFFAGRYVPEKDIEQLWTVAEKLLMEFGDWEFHFIGKGPLWERRLLHDRVVHHGFLDGTNLESVIQTGAVFVLPSIYEPWGVVVNEFAAAGYPLVLSDKVGARTAIATSKNAIIFPAGNTQGMYEALKRMMQASNEERILMGRESHDLSMKMNEENYAAAILKMMR
ncbi:MAG: glycosyltransferase family 4 protein [Flavobacteriales bacterium]